MVEHLPSIHKSLGSTQQHTCAHTCVHTHTHTQPCSPAAGQSQLEVHMSLGVTLALSGCPVASVSWEMCIIQVSMSSQDEKK